MNKYHEDWHWFEDFMEKEYNLKFVDVTPPTNAE